MAKDKFALEQLVGRLGLSEDLTKAIVDGTATEETFNEGFEKIWISVEKAKTDPEIVDKAIKAHDGKLFGLFETGMKKAADKLGVAFEKEDMKVDGRDIKAVEMIDVLAQKVEVQVSELKDNASKGNDEKVIKLEKKVEEANTQTAHFKDLYEEKDTAFNTLESESQATLQTFKMDTKLASSVGKIRFKDDITDIEKLGYKAEISNLHKELDEDDKLIIKGADGEIFWNENKTIELTADEAVMAIADKHKLVKKNAITQVVGNTNGKPNEIPEENQLRKVRNADKRPQTAE